MATTSLHVSNLPFNVSIADLTERFGKYGATSARVVEGRGMAFVDIDSDKLESAISENNNEEVEGLNITVKQARQH